MINLERVSTTKLIDELASIALPMLRLINQNMLLFILSRDPVKFPWPMGWEDKILHRAAGRRLETEMASQYFTPRCIEW